MDKAAATLLNLKQESQHHHTLQAIHSPPASPREDGWSKLPPMHSPQEEPARTMLPSLVDRELYTESSPNSTASLFAKQADERRDSLSPCEEPNEKPQNKSLYIMFPQFKSMENGDLKRYIDDCYRELKRMPGFRPVNPPVTHSRRVAYSPPRPTRITKPRPAHVPAKVAQPKAKAIRIPATHADRDTASPTSPGRALKTPVRVRERNSASVEPQARKRAAPSKIIVTENWLQLPDYSPPTSTLDSMSMRLKVHWKGAPNDLSDDPEVGHLHPQEVEIAQDLKLPAAQYLANKRRIFEARLKSIRDRKNFTKTAAQQACNIDVNKTSQLYEAYERVGWFNEAVFSKWLT